MVAAMDRTCRRAALLFAVQTGISSELTAGEQLRAKLVAHEENACDFVSGTEDTGVRFALDGIRAPWKIYCIRSAYYIYKSYGAALYREMLSILVDAWDGDLDSFLSGILHGIRVRKDYEISITLNASFNQVEQLKAVSTYDGAEIFEGISEKGA